MSHYLTLLHFLFSTPFLGGTAYAQGLSGVVDSVGGGAGISSPSLSTDPVALIKNLINNELILLVDVVATLFLVISGLRLVYRSSEEQIERSKRRIAGSIVGIMLAHLTPQLLDIIYGNSASNTRFETPANILAGVNIAGIEVCGIIHWVEVLIAVIAVTVIIVSGLKTVVSYGSEEGISSLKRTVIAVIAGCVLLTARVVIMQTLGMTTFDLATNCSASVPGNATPGSLLTFLLLRVNELLGFLALIAVGIIVYAGIMMIISRGAEDTFTRMKDLIIRAAIGLTVVLVSYTIMRLVFATI